MTSVATVQAEAMEPMINARDIAGPWLLYAICSNDMEANLLAMELQICWNYVKIQTTERRMYEIYVCGRR